MCADINCEVPFLELRTSPGNLVAISARSQFACVSYKSPVREHVESRPQLRFENKFGGWSMELTTNKGTNSYLRSACG